MRPRSQGQAMPPGPTAEVPLIGRAAELSVLKTAADSVKNGRFSAVLVSGEVGIGKSRLADEACEYARGIGFEIITGLCCKAQSEVSYALFVEAFRRLGSYFCLNGRKGRGGTGRFSTSVAAVNRLRINASLAQARPVDSERAQADLFEEVRRSLTACGERRPLMLLLEDIQWADSGSLSLLAYLVRVLVRARVFILATCGPRENPAEVNGALTECVRYRCCRRLRLKGLAEPEIVKFAEQLLGAEMADQAARLGPELTRLTNGNPRFVERIIRHLREQTRLSKSSGHAKVELQWEARFAADDELREVVDTHLRGLSPRCHEVLRAAAILGDEFEFDVLARMVQFGASELAEALDEATRTGILTLGGDEGADYAFAHALVRQSLYERHNHPARRARHAQAARAIEAIHCVDLAPYVQQLAIHYTRAAAKGDLAKAVAYSTSAGQMAYEAGAYADAIKHWRSALKIANGSDRKLRAELAERLGEASVRAATPAEAARYLQASLKLYKELGQPADVARVQAHLFTLLSLCRVGQSISLLTMSPMAARGVTGEALAETPLVVCENPSAEAESEIGAAIAAHARFCTDKGLASSKRAMELAQNFEDPSLWCQAAALNGHFLLAAGKVRQGMALMEQAADRALSTGDAKPRLATAWLLGFSHLLLWDPGAAENAIETALIPANSQQVDFLRQILLAHLGIARAFSGRLDPARSVLSSAAHRFLEANLRFLEGEWAEAETLLKQQLERAHPAESTQQHWIASFWLARLKRIGGDYDSALELLKRTPLIARSLLRVPEEIATRSELVLLRLARGEIADARSEVRKCRSLLKPSEDWRGLSGFVARAEAALLTEEGHLETAQELWREAERVFSYYLLPWEVAETLVTCGSLLLRHGRRDEGAAKLGAAIEICRNLKLGNRWEERIQKLRDQPGGEPLSDFAGSISPAFVSSLEKPLQAVPASSGMSHPASAHDLALLATLIHDAIAHLMNAIDKASKMRVPIERIAAATERLSRIDTPIDRLVRAVELAIPGSLTAGSPRARQHARPSHHKLNRSHDPGRPLGPTKLC